MSKNKLATWLFETNAMRISPENKPFWYTSGTIGPYYINTHFLYGNEEKASELLKVIDIVKSDKNNCPGKLLELIKSNYARDIIFKGLIDEMVSYIKENIDVSKIDYISGGERRDWFFSLIIADILNKPHISIFKDHSIVVTYSKGDIPKLQRTENREQRTDAVLHIADIITEASSYDRAWIPAIRDSGGIIKWSLVVIDRKQGGGELLNRNGISSLNLVSIDETFFSEAFEMELINKGQYEMLMEYTENPKESMKRFLKNHPEFMENSLNGDDKTKERAKLCIEKGFYE